MLPPATRRLARRQHGVVSRAQILSAAGVRPCRIKKLLACGVLEPLHRGVYITGGAPLTDRARIAAAVLAAGDSCVASHRAAAHLLELGELELRLEITVPHGCRPQVHGATIYRTRVLPPEHKVRALEIPATTPARTICDLASVLSRDELELVLDHALVRRRVRCEYVREALAALPLCKGQKTLAALLDARAGGRARVESPLEQKLQRLLEDEGIPGGRPQHRVTIDGRRYRIDVAFPDARLALELDSYRWHATRAGWEGDHKRAAALVAHGWRVLPVTTEDVEDGRTGFVARLRSALAA